MKPCRECGHMVSTDAKACPNCGKASPAQMTIGTGTGCLIIVALLVFAGYCFGGSGGGGAGTAITDEDRAMGTVFAAKDAVRSALRDPESARFGVVSAHRLAADSGRAGFVACGTVNAKNAFGGYTGMKNFVSAGTAAATFIEGAGMENSEFAELWNQACTGAVVASSRAD